MILTKKFLEFILPAFAQEVTKEEQELIYGEHHFDAKLIKNEDDELTITIKYKQESLKEKFEKWCQQIDDDIFVEACEKFEELTGRKLKEVDEENLYTLFETVIREVVKSKINTLSKKYLGD